jgi:transposase-like protein
MHASKRAEKIHGRGPDGKAIVATVLERGGEIRAKVCKTRRKPELQEMVRENVDAGSAVYSDALKSYEGPDEFQHQVIDHAEAYVDEQVFRYNNRQGMNDSDRFDLAVSQIVGKRLTYKELTGREDEPEF